VEVGGAIVQKDAKFFYTAPVTTDQTMALGFRVALQRGETIVAWYHTHPAAPEWDPYQKNEMEYFSKGDVAIAKRLGVPAYLTSEPAGDVLVFDPQLDRRRITSTGRAVGRRVAILPISLHSAWLAK
jgi:proteasome lid subunit RPN8/RPN11